MRVLVAPQEFKGSLSAAEAAHAIAEGVRRATPSAVIDEVPLSDGGPGFVDAMLAARGGTRIESEVHDPLMRPLRAAWGGLDGGTAIVEMAAASGLVLLTDAERDPLVTTTYGTGELILAALERGCSEIILGIGGSATVDAGAGAMQSLGARLLDASSADLAAGGAALAQLDRVDLDGVDERLPGTRIRIAADVTNTLCGPEGASAVFGPQKGASPDDVLTLESALQRFAAVVRAQCGLDLLSIPGGGAAGGIATGLSVIAQTAIEPGFALVAEAIGLDARIVGADIIITGEGRLDAQTAYGKTAAGVARLAHTHNKPAGVVAGTVRGDFDASAGAFDAVEQAAPEGMGSDEAMRRAPDLVRDAATRIMRKLLDQSERR
jgi:glycerate kinase